MFNIKITGVSFVASHFMILYSTKYIYHILESCLLVYTMADRKRKIELEESDIEKSPKRRKKFNQNHSIEGKRIGQVHNHNADTSSNIEHSNFGSIKLLLFIGGVQFEMGFYYFNIRF